MQQREAHRARLDRGADRASSPSTSFVVSAYASRKIGSPKFAHCWPKPPTKPFTPATPTLAPLIGRIVCERSSTTTPASASARDEVGGPVGLPVVVAEHRDDRAPTARGRRPRRRRPRRPGRAGSGRPRAGSGRPAPRPARNASRTRSRSAAPAWMSPAAATRTVFAMRGSYPDWRLPLAGTDASMPSDGTVQRPAGRDEAAPPPCCATTGSQFALAGGQAIYARGGPESGHDVDFVLREEDAERALRAARETRASAAERPPEAGSTRSTTTNGAMIDLIFAPNSRPEVGRRRCSPARTSSRSTRSC